MRDLLAFLGSAAKILEVYSDPKRRRLVKLLLAIEAAEHLLDIKDRVGEYENVSGRHIKKQLIHWNKRFSRFKDGV